MSEIEKPTLARNTLFILIAKLIIFAANLGVNLVLAQYLSIENYGIYGVVVSFFSIFQILVYEGIYNTVSKFTAKDPSTSLSLEKLFLKVQIIGSLIITLGIYFLSPLIARILNAQNITPYLQITSLIIIINSISALYLGLLSGRKRFGLVSIALVTSSICRLFLILICLLWNLSLQTIFVFYTLSFLPHLIFSRIFYKSNRNENRAVPQDVIKSALVFTLLSLLVNAFIYSGILFLQYLLKDPVETGLFQSASVISRTLWLFFVTVSTTLLPSIVNAIGSHDWPQVRKYIHQSIRYLLVFSIPMTLIISINAEEILLLLFSQTYTEGALILNVLVWAIEIYSLYYLLNTVIIASYKYLTAILISVISLLIAVLLYFILVPEFKAVGIAVSALFAAATCLIITSILVINLYKTKLPLVLLAKLGLTSLIIIWVNHIMVFTQHFIVLECTILYGLFFIILWILREAKSEDIRVLRNIFGFHHQ